MNIEAMIFPLILGEISDKNLVWNNMKTYIYMHSIIINNNEGEQEVVQLMLPMPKWCNFNRS